MLKNTIATVAVLACYVGATDPVKAWNLVCGVSINMAAKENDRKWDADSSALYGISHFYAAVAELQRLQLNNDKSFTNPTSQLSDKSATEQSTIDLKKSVDAFSRGLKLAEEYNLGDEKGLKLLKALVEGTTKLYETIEYKRVLPTLTDVQAVSKNINEFTAYGIELSQKHLGMSMRGHGIGGAEYKIPD
jgi:hypothetical protein